MKDGRIEEIDTTNNTLGVKRLIAEGHPEGGVYGLTVVNEDHVLTVGDDNIIKCWNIKTH